MRFTLRRYGFDGDSNVRVLRDAAASRQGIADGFRWLAERATDSADVVVVFYSGHGSRTRDTNGDEALVTPGDTLDEALVPWDAKDVYDARQLVIDDQIGIWLRALGTKNVTMIVDGCFSGTITRAVTGMTVSHARGTLGGTSAPGGAATQRQFLDNPAHTLITASGPGETAAELPLGEDHRWFGALTYELTRALDAAGPTARYDEIMRQVARDIRALPNAMQTPQLEGDRVARLFHVREAIPSRPFATVTAALGDKLTVDAGAVEGVRHGAIYDVFAPGDKRLEGGGLGQLVIDSVGELRAWGHIVAGASSVPLGARAALASLPRGGRRLERLRLYVDPQAAVARAAIESLPFVTIGDSTTADARLIRSNGVLQVVVGGVPLPPLSEALCPLLARAFAIQSFNLIDNPAFPGSMEMQVALMPQGMPPVESPEAIDSVYVGRAYDFYVQINADERTDRYVTIASEGYAGLPSVLYPVDEGPNQPFPLNMWRKVADSVVMEEPAGLEVVKMLVGTDQYDFRSLVASFDKCGAGTRLPGDDSKPKPVTAWRTFERQVLVLPERP
jgi:caspase domain-containing protein